MKVSIVVPLYNEAANVTVLYRELCEFAAGEKRVTEMIFVDDGSVDNTYGQLVAAAKDAALPDADRVRAYGLRSGGRASDLLMGPDSYNSCTTIALRDGTRRSGHSCCRLTSHGEWWVVLDGGVT